MISVDAKLVNTQALERTDRNDQITSDETRQPVRPVTPTGQTGQTQKNAAKPKTSSSEGTPSELEDLGLSWGWQATQDVLERRRDEQRTARGLEKLGFGEK